jgi:hypothetical protein
MTGFSPCGRAYQLISNIRDQMSEASEFPARRFCPDARAAIDRHDRKRLTENDAFSTF